MISTYIVSQQIHVRNSVIMLFVAAIDSTRTYSKPKSHGVLQSSKLRVECYVDKKRGRATESSALH